MDYKDYIQDILKKLQLLAQTIKDISMSLYNSIIQNENKENNSSNLDFQKSEIKEKLIDIIDNFYKNAIGHYLYHLANQNSLKLEVKNEIFAQYGKNLARPFFSITDNFDYLDTIEHQLVNDVIKSYLEEQGRKFDTNMDVDWPNELRDYLLNKAEEEANLIFQKEYLTTEN